MIDIEQEWKEFDSKVLPKNAHAIQRQEMRRAFFVGVLISLSALSDLSAQDEDRANESLEDMHRQCREFFERVQIGIA